MLIAAVVAGHSAGDPYERDDGGDTTDYERSDTERSLPGRGLRNFLLMLCLVGLLAFTFLGSHRSRRLSVMGHPEGTTPGSEFKSKTHSADIPI